MAPVRASNRASKVGAAHFFGAKQALLFHPCSPCAEGCDAVTVGAGVEIARLNGVAVNAVARGKVEGQSMVLAESVEKGAAFIGKAFKHLGIAQRGQDMARIAA